MNIVEKLLCVTEIEPAVKEMKSARLSKMLGQDTKIKIREISGRKFEAARNAAKSKGDGAYESSLMCATYGIVEPDLRNAELMKHFNVSTPKDLCEKLFSAEVYKIAEEIINLSGLNTSEDEVKN